MVLAFVFALGRSYPLEAIAILVLACIIFAPAAIASPGRRLEVGYWTVALAPVIVLMNLHATWLIAWCVLGHRPRPALDDPNQISMLVDVPVAMTAFSLVLLPISLGPGFILSLGVFPGRPLIKPLPILPLAWVLAIVVLWWDPLWVFFWFLD